MTFIRRKAKRAVIVVSFLVVAGGVLFYQHGRTVWVPVYYKLAGKRTLDDVLATYGTAARERLRYHFETAAVEYPPSNIVLLASKFEERLEVWSTGDTAPVFIRAYPIQALSGQSGPKLAEGDGQVPEGFYRVIGLNPNSAYHLSLKLNYPNELDLIHARAEGRNSPGSDIFIHGKDVSVGCLAMGDRAVEDLFVMVADVGKDNVSIVIAPHDPRLAPLSALGHADWVRALYSRIEHEFRRYRIASES